MFRGGDRGIFFMVQINSKKRVSRRVAELRRTINVNTQKLRRKAIICRFLAR
jgi:hypothetical protein